MVSGSTVLVLALFLVAHIATTIAIGFYLNRAAKREVMNAANNVLQGLTDRFPMFFPPTTNGDREHTKV